MKKFFSKFAYAILPFSIFIVTLLLTFYGNQLLTNMAEPGSMHYGTTWPYNALDDIIPLVPWFVYIYFLTFPVSIFTYFYLASKNKKQHYDIFLTLVISFLISGIIFLSHNLFFILPDSNRNPSLSQFAGRTNRRGQKRKVSVKPQKRDENRRVSSII